jgi:dephospho-CoA kinase
VVAQESEAIIAEFGEGVSDGAGGVDRRALGELVFADRRRLRRLEELVHPEMRRRVARRIEESAAPGLCINAALLFTMGLHRHCTAVLMVRASLLQRLRRGRRRDELPVTQIVLRILRQRKLFPKHLLRDVDIYSVKNSGKPQRLVERVAELIELFER